MRKTWPSPSAATAGPAIHIRQEPAWAQLVESAWVNLSHNTDGWLGGHRLPALFWRIPIGRPPLGLHHPKGPWLENSIGSVLFSLEQWVLSRTNAHGRELATIPVSEEAARRINPGFVADHNRWAADDTSGDTRSPNRRVTIAHTPVPAGASSTNGGSAPQAQRRAPTATELRPVA